MAEKNELLSDTQRREMKQMEYELLYAQDKPVRRFRSQGPTTLGCLDSSSFLLGYIVLALGANAYMTMTTLGEQACYFYILNAFFSTLGIISLVGNSSKLLFVYAGYFVASFLFGSLVAGGAIMFLLQSDVCMAVEKVLPGMGLDALCFENKMLFQAVTIGTLLMELLIEAFILAQIKKIYDHIDSSQDRSRDGYEPLPSGMPGTIKIVLP